MSSRRRFVYYWLPTAAWMALILVGTSLPRVPVPGVTGGDKLAHLVAYGGLGVLLMRALGCAVGMTGRYGIAITLAVGGAFGALDELHQIPLPGRGADARDWLADLIGLALGAGLMYLLLWACAPHARSEDENIMRRE